MKHIYQLPFIYSHHLLTIFLYPKMSKSDFEGRF